VADRLLQNFPPNSRTPPIATDDEGASVVCFGHNQDLLISVLDCRGLPWLVIYCAALSWMIIVMDWNGVGEVHGMRGSSG
jgi:hypothetical protein